MISLWIFFLIGQHNIETEEHIRINKPIQMRRVYLLMFHFVLVGTSYNMHDGHTGFKEQNNFAPWIQLHILHVENIIFKWEHFTSTYNQLEFILRTQYTFDKYKKANYTFKTVFFKPLSKYIYMILKRQCVK